MKMPKNVDLLKSINREKVIEPSIANNEKNIGCPPLVFCVDGVKVNPCQKIQKYEDDISCRRAEVVPQALLCCLLVTLYECC
jgi:hypothetical protein